MLKFLSSLIILLLIQTKIYTQSIQRDWEQGKLDWNDFQGNPLRSSDKSSEFVYQISFITKKIKLQDTVLLTFVTKNEMNPKYSWVKVEDQSLRLLRYNQALFDILELNRRSLQSGLLSLGSLNEANSLLQRVIANSRDDFNRIQTDTEFGKNEEAISFWEEELKTRLADFPLIRIPEFEESNFGYGLQVGLGSGTFTNSLSDHFNPTFNFLFGFDIALKNTVLYLNGTLGFNKIRKEFEEGGRVWPKDLKTGVAVIDLSLGQSIINNGKHKLTPFVGLGILEFTAIKDEDQFQDFRLVDYGIIYGVNYDFKFRKNIKLVPGFAGVREKIEQNIRFRLYVLPSQFDTFKGTSVNLSFSYSFFGRLIKIKQ
jgi:hypothetical protein